MWLRLLRAHVKNERRQEWLVVHNGMLQVNTISPPEENTYSRVDIVHICERASIRTKSLFHLLRPLRRSRTLPAVRRPLSESSIVNKTGTSCLAKKDILVRLIELCSVRIGSLVGTCCPAEMLLNNSFTFLAVFGGEGGKVWSLFVVVSRWVKLSRLIFTPFCCAALAN